MSNARNSGNTDQWTMQERLKHCMFNTDEGTDDNNMDSTEEQTRWMAILKQYQLINGPVKHHG